MAIAFNAGSGANGSAGTTQTLSHTCTGSNLILWVSVFSNNSHTITGVTYNGVSMTSAISVNSSGNEWEDLYYLINPATGANNIVASFSTSCPNPSVSGASFTGAKQSGQPDGTTSGTGNAASATGSITTVADNCMAVFMMRCQGGLVSASTNATKVNGQLLGELFYSTAAKTPAGTLSIAVTMVSGVYGYVMTSFSPATAASPLTIALRRAF